MLSKFNLYRRETVLKTASEELSCLISGKEFHRWDLTTVKTLVLPQP